MLDNPILMLSLVHVGESFCMLQVSSSNPCTTKRALTTLLPCLIFYVIIHLGDKHLCLSDRDRQTNTEDTLANEHLMS